jgi:hypothetical protein
MNNINHLPIEQQIEIIKNYIANSENHIKHYSSNPTQLDELKFKIQTKGLAEHNKKLHKQLENLEKQSINN